MIRTSKISCMYLYHKQSSDYNLYSRYIRLSGECKTIKMTQDELNKIEENKINDIVRYILI